MTSPASSSPASSSPASSSPASNGLARVVIVGASGFMGGELVRVLASHPKVAIAMVCGHRSAGKSMAELRPSLAALGLDISPVDVDAIASAADVAFLALPHGESAELAAALVDKGVRVIDLGSDFRLRDAEDYPRYYGREHPRPDLLGSAYYCLSELTGPPPDACKLVANPGCFATALALGIVPLVPHLCPNGRINAMGITGSSGSGAALSARVHHSLRPTSLGAYKALEHQHMGELRQLMVDLHGSCPAVDFVPHSGPFVRGIHLTLSLRRSEFPADAFQVLSKTYAEAGLVTVQRGPVSLGAVVGSCSVAIGVSGDEDIQLVFVVIDNLLKGGSGQAVQNLNLMMGWSELEGVPRLGMWP